MATLSDLFIEERFPSGWKLVPVVIYFPVGVALAIIRLFIAMQAVIAAIIFYKLPTIRLVVLRIMFGILGIFVFKENEEAEDESVKIIVSNNVSVLDHLAIYLLKDSTSVQLPELPSCLYFIFNYKNLGNQRDQKNLIQKVKEFIDEDATIDIQPEMTTTSGKKGLLRFSPWPCKLNQPIQPVAIRIWRSPLMDIAPSTINTSWCSEAFWFLFVPFTVFKITFIPVIKQLKNENPEDMSKRLEKVIADELKIETTNFRDTDKIELEKRLVAEENAQKLARSLGFPDPQTMEMASRVKEVLPHIPMHIIARDLARTKSVDLTITNFLEGLVRYTPDKGYLSVPAPFNIPSDMSDPSFNGVQPSTSQDASMKLFHKSAQERMISFQERKLKLIQSAREKYIEKHALNVMNSS